MGRLRVAPALAARFTAGELAALSAVAAQVHARGACYLPHDRLAAAAGVSASTARNAARALTGTDAPLALIIPLQRSGAN